MANGQLKAARLQRRWSQAIAAEKVGVSVLTYSRWEKGSQTPYLATLDQLCNAFGMSPEDLGFGDRTPGPDPALAVSTVSSGISPVLTDEQNAEQFFSSPAFSRSPIANVFTLSSGSMQIFSEDEVPADSAAWFSEKLAQITIMVTHWSGQALFCAELQKLVDLELRMPDEMKSQYDPDEYVLSRRNALLVLAALPKGLQAMLQHAQKADIMQEEMLPLCAASITSCWQLMEGKEITAVDRAIARYLPYLVTWARRPSRYQPMAAYLAAQGCLLMGLVELHRFHFQQWLAYCIQAVEHAEVSKDRTLYVYALVFLGSAFKENGRAQMMLQAHQRAASLLEGVMPLVQSKVFAELARSYARNGQVQKALRYISEARAIFPGETKDVPCFVASDCGLFQIVLLEGLTHLDLGEFQSDDSYYAKAGDSLAQVETIPALAIPDRLRTEIVNQRALVAVKIGDMKGFRHYLIEGVGGAQALGSQKRRQEAIEVYKEARRKWPNESQVKELADLLL